MKILCINSGMVGDNIVPSGCETRFIEIAKNWSAVGHEIHLLSSEAGKRLCDRLGLPVRLHPYPRIKTRGRWAHFLRLLQTLCCLPRSIFEEKFDLVYSVSELSYDVIPGLLMKRRFPGLPWAVVVHMLTPFPPWKRKASTLFNSTAFLITERVGLAIARRFADILLPVSDLTASQLAKMKIPRESYATVNCGVVFDKIQAVTETVRTKTVDAVFMKRVQAVKGAFDLIEIWQKVVEEKPDAKLVVVGEGFDHENMKRMGRERHLEKNIEYAGVIYDFDEKFRMLAKAKLFLHPSHEENWAIVIGESLASGAPVITYDLEELRSVWKESCLYIKKNDIESFAKQVLHLLKHEEELSERRKIGLQYVQRYDWKQIAEKELNLINQKSPPV